MTDSLSFLLSAAELHIGSSERSPALKDLVDRIVAIARMSATDLNLLMGTEQGADIARLDIVENEGADPENYLRSWDSIGRASPAALSGTQYDVFLRGENPTVVPEQKIEPLELYVPDLKLES